MTKKQNPNQSEMFVQGSVNPRLEMPVDVTTIQSLPKVDLTPNAEQFPTIDLAERAIHLDKALLAFGKYNQRTGLQYAGAENSPLRRKIEKRYDVNTEQVVEGAANTKDRLMTEAKVHFAKAIGMNAMIASGIQTEEEAKQFARVEFSAFTQRYADSHNTPARKTMRQKMQRTQREQARIRKVS